MANILSTLTALREQTVKCSTSFVDNLRHQSIQNNVIMVSFDVESHFANISVNADCFIAQQRMQAYNEITDRTTLLPSKVTNLLKFELRSTDSMHNGNFYEHFEGVSMGSPASAIIANLFVGNFEQLALKPCPSEYAHSDMEEIDRRYLHSHRKIHSQQPSFLPKHTATDHPLHHWSAKQQPG